MYVRKNNKLTRITDKNSICYYSKGTQHKCCTHQHYCIFNNNRHTLEQDIHQLEQKITTFENIKNAAINGEIIYHQELDPYYTTNGTDVKLEDKFLNALNVKIDNLKYDLKNLINFRLDVIHGKIGGYGYES